MQMDDPRPPAHTRLLSALLAGISLVLAGCWGDPLPLTVGEVSQPAPIIYDLSGYGFDDEVQSCDEGEEERDLYLAYNDFNTFAVLGAVITRCTDEQDDDRLIAGVTYDLTENISISGCVNPSFGGIDFSVAGPWLVGEASCDDGFRIVAGRIGAGGSVSWETVIEEGDGLGSGVEYVEPRFSFPFVRAGFDGAQPFFALAAKVRPTGTQDEPSIAVGLCRRDDVPSWSCQAEYFVGEGDLSSYQDLAGVRVDVDCPPESIPGDMDCPIPATPTLAMSFRDMLDPFVFPQPPVTAIAEGSFDGAAPLFIARKDDPVPGFGMRVYASFGEGFELGRGGGAFSATDDAGDDYALRWEYQVTDEIVIAAEGDPLEGSSSTFDRPLNFGYWNGRAVFHHMDDGSGAQQIVYESGRTDDMVRLRTLFRTGVDVREGLDVIDVSLFSRAFDQRVMLNGVAIGVSTRRLVATPIDSFEKLDDFATPLYGTNPTTGFLSRIGRAERRLDLSVDLGTLDLQSLLLTPDGDLLAGSGDGTDSPLFRIDPDTFEVELVSNTPLGGIVGLAASPTQAWATNGAELYTLDPSTGATSLVGSFLDGDDTPILDVSGLSWVPDSEALVAVAETGNLYQVDPVDARLDLRHELSLPGSLRSVHTRSSQDFVVGSDDGRAYQLGVSLSFGSGAGGYGAGPVADEATVITILDTGDAPLSGLTAAMVPEPGALVLGVTALLCVSALRGREARLRT